MKFFFALCIVCLTGQALAAPKPVAALLASLTGPEACGNYISSPGLACNVETEGEAQALEIQNVQTSMISAAGGDNIMTQEEFLTYPSQVGVYSLNTPRNLQFSSNCFFKSPNQPLDCAPGECIINVPIPELNNTTWGEMAANECASYYPDVDTPVALGPAIDGNVLISVINKCQNMTWTSPSVYILTDEWNNNYIMHASGGNTTESVKAAADNVDLPEGWSVQSVNITKPITIYPRMGEDGSCYYTIARDNQDNSYHEINCGGSVQPTDFNLKCPTATMSAAGKAKAEAAAAAAPSVAPTPAPSSASRSVVGAAVAATAALAMAF